MRNLAKLFPVLLTLVAGAQDGSTAKQYPPTQPRATQPRATQPRALLIGDSISLGYTLAVKSLLAGRVEVQRVKGNAGDTIRGLAKIDEWLAPDKGEWDVIHFNWGLWDLCYRHPGSNKPGKRDKANGTVTSAPEDYAANLHKLIDRLEQSGADLIFATTTPVPKGEAGRKLGDDLRYNETAVAVMKKRGVMIDDLHAVMAGRMREYARGAGDVHFTKAGSKLLAEQVVKSIARQVKQRGSRRTVKLVRKARWTPSRTVEYAQHGEVSLKLHLFEPDHHSKTDRRPAIVFFFGGGWVGGTPEQFYPYSDYLAGRGMVAIAAEYRIKKKHGTTPFECVADGLAAIRYLRNHSRELGINPEQIAAGGGSAGGHVAAATATVKANSVSRPNALVLFNPVYDNGPEGYGFNRLGDRYREISPLHNIDKGMAPTLVMLGTKDKLIPVSTAKNFQAAMRKVESRSELILYDGRPHGFFNYGRGDGLDYHATLRATDKFLVSLGYLQGKPTIR